MWDANIVGGSFMLHYNVNFFFKISCVCGLHFMFNLHKMSLFHIFSLCIFINAGILCALPPPPSLFPLSFFSNYYDKLLTHFSVTRWTFRHLKVGWVITALHNLNCFLMILNSAQILYNYNPHNLFKHLIVLTSLIICWIVSAVANLWDTKYGLHQSQA